MAITIPSVHITVIARANSPAPKDLPICLQLASPVLFWIRIHRDYLVWIIHVIWNMETLTASRQLTRAQLRKTSKPLLEKKRRARINASLVQLKALVLESVKKDTARYSKLEKADVLELTVRHLRMLQRQQLASAMTIDPSIISKYRAGFSECLSEVCRYMSAIDGLDTDVRMRLMEHLASCMQRVGPTPEPQCAQAPVAMMPQHMAELAVTSSMPMTSCVTSPLQVHIPAGASPPHSRLTAGIPTSRGSPPTTASPPQFPGSFVSGSFHLVPACNKIMSPENSHLYNMATNAGLLASLSVSDCTERIEWCNRELTSSSPIARVTPGQALVKQESVWRPW